MTCPNCGKTYEYGSTCPYCKIDTILYAGTVRLSDALYNKGLAKIKVSDLSGAMESLSKSVSVNKNNTKARNLLGLLQYEIGHIGDALKNWVISLGLQKEDNPAQGYIEVAQKNGRALERLDDAIRIYNQALNDIWQKSDDMAIIKLKQAVDINPKFVDALNLLSFCYLIQKDKAKAQAIVERVLAIDTSNSIALGYYNKLNPGGGRHVAGKGSRKRTASAEQQIAAPYKKVVLHERRNVNFHLEGILCLVIGVVCTLGVMFVLVNPALARNQANQIEDMQSRLNQAEQAHEAVLEEMGEEIAELHGQISEHAESARYWAEQYDNLGRSVQILNAYELLREDRLREAVDSLANIGAEGLLPDIADRFYEIRAVAFPRLARQYFDEGFAAYHARPADFGKARVDFERAYRYAQHLYDDPLLGDILYYLGWTFSQDIDMDLAIHYFERLLEEFPTHRYVNPARNRLNQITD